MIVKAYWLSCDGSPASLGPYHAPGCPGQMATTARTSAAARREAKRAGWTRVAGGYDSRDLSRQCAAREEGEER